MNFGKYTIGGSHLHWAFLLLAASSFALTYTQPFVANGLVELCDNAIDDDNDGLIDLNDPDCDCPPAAPLSLIPNPSFEQQDCCPGNNSQMYCANGWIQASIPTTDFIHTCNWVGWEGYLPPLPLPDGEGAIGFRDGRPGDNGNGPQPDWKEYAGACLTEPLRIGETYRLEFYVGFAHLKNSPPTHIAIYGNESCINMPFDSTDAGYGCPTNDPLRNWFELGKVWVSGHQEWKIAHIDFSPPRNIEAIAIGPSCRGNPSQIPLYYFMDKLVLARQEEFNFEISARGNPCAGTERLMVPQTDTLSYQWYKDGIALIGQTTATLDGPLARGSYQVRAVGSSSCMLTDPYPFSVPVKFARQEVRICPDEIYRFGERELAQAGTYLDTLTTAGGCDSIVELQLIDAGARVDTVYASIYQSETWSAGNYRLDSPGAYNLTFSSVDNCDSLVYLILDKFQVYIPDAFSPNGDGANDEFSILGSDDLQDILLLEIYDRWGGKVFSVENAGLTASWNGRSGNREAPPGVYAYRAQIVFRDGEPRVVAGFVSLVR